jgi:holliday junction DNA helicase RuvA
MIAYLSGRLLEKHPNKIILDVQGVGYEVQIPLSTFYELGDPGALTQLHIHTHVREDALALFGFKTLSEKQIFELLTSVSGIGPKLAVTILSGMSVAELIPSIRQGNHTRLISIPGVGKKTAERLVVELRDKLAKFEIGESPAQILSGSLTPHQEDVISALVNLGYPKGVADRAVDKAAASLGSEGSFEALLRKSLQLLSK